MIAVATYNLLHGMPVLGGQGLQPQRDADGRITGPPIHTDAEPLRRSAAALDADVVGLQEVDRHQERSGHHDQARVVADAVGAEHVIFAPSLLGTPGTPGWHPAGPGDDEALIDDDVDHGPMYGVALVSRLPVLEHRIERFPAPRASLPLLVPGEGRRPQVVRVPDEPRTAILAVLDGPDGPFTVATTHLSFVPGVNVRQLRELVRHADGLPRPLLLIGDLNLPGRWPARFSGLRPLATGATYPSFGPRIQFDHVLADGMPDDVRTTATVHRLPVSDHCAVRVVLERAPARTVIG